MTRTSGIRLVFAVALVVFAHSKFAFAAIDMFPNLFLRSNSIAGECIFGIDDFEPFAAMNSACETVKLSPSGPLRLAYEPISAFQLGWPRTGFEQWRWDTEYVGVPGPDFYCQIFGISILDDPPIVELGHHSDPNENDTRPGVQRCKTQALLPQYDIWRTTVFCFGPPDDRVVGFAAVFALAPNYSKEVDRITGYSTGSICIYTQEIQLPDW